MLSGMSERWRMLLIGRRHDSFVAVLVDGSTKIVTLRSWLEQIQQEFGTRLRCRAVHES